MTDLKSTGDDPINDRMAAASELMADASAAAEQTQAAVRTFRGRAVEELIPRIREELGSDAIVLRSSEGLSGGVFGFFQKRHVEVEARAPLAHERADLPRNDRATSEGLTTPAIKALIDQAQPFAAELATAQAAAGARVAAAGHDEEAAPSAFVADPLPAAAGLYGPQPNLAAMYVAAPIEPGVAPASPVDDDSLADETVAGEPAGDDPAADEPVAGDPGANGFVADLAVPDAFDESAPAAAAQPAVAGTPTDRAADAGRLRRRLIESGLSDDLAADVVGEAVDHFLPFATGRPLEVHVRTVLARRLQVLSDLGPGSRTLAFVGSGGAGKTSAAANLAVAYAAAGRRVAAIVLGEHGDAADLAARLEPLGIPVHVAGTGERAGELIARTRPDIAVIDVCESSDHGGLEAVASDLHALDADEIHLALPATLSAAAAREEHARQRMLGVTHLCLTHSDATAHPGAPLGLTLERELPVSYVCTRATTEPADAASLAERLLP